MEIKLFKKQNEIREGFLDSFVKKGITLLMVFFAVFSETNAQITTGFELDGNASAVLPNPPDDWNLIYNGTSNAQVTTNIVTDLDNIFQGGGSKDDLDINNWGWTTGSVPDKDDILHGGVALYNNCRLYFFADRYATNGSANIGFWLFKNNISINPNGSFSGVHSVGDLFIVSEFVNGGGTSIIKAYRWVGSGGNTNGTLDSVPVNGTNSYAITNTSNVASPWPYDPKTGPDNIFGNGAFFEGGIDLCAIPGLDPCFTSFLIETRSSFSVDAVLKDFLNGSFTSSPQVVLNGASRCINGASVTLTPAVTGGITPYTYVWAPGGATTPSITVSPNSTTTYTVTVNGANGCVKTDTAVVTVSPLPNVNAGVDKTITCTSPSVALSGSSGTGGVSFSWSTNNGNIVSGGTTATPTVNAAGTYVLTVTSGSGCSASDTVSVISNMTPPNVNAGADKTLTCVVTSVMLNGSSSTGGVTYAWTTIGGNIVSGGTTTTPTVNAAGTYILTVTNPTNGCIARDTAIVNLNNTLPNANAGADKTLTCTTTSVVLNGSSSTGGASFSWTTTGGNIVSGNLTATPTVNAAGTYIVTVTHPTNGCTARDTVMVNLNNTLPNANAGADSVINCFNTSISLNGSSTTANVTFSWSTLNGNIVSGGATASPVINAGGTYNLIVTDTINGCTANDAATVSVDITAPNVNAGPDKALTCDSTQVMLNGSSTTPGATFTWTASNGGVIYSGANTANPIVQIPGTYILTVTNPVNGCTAQDSADVTQNINAPDVNAGADMTLNCTVLSVVLNGSSATPGTTYLWTTLNGNIVSGATTLTPTVNAAGTYVLTVTNTVTGCQASDAADVILDNTPPNVSAGQDGLLTCTVTSTVLGGSSTTTEATFNWTTGTGNIVSGGTTLTPTVNLAGTYILTVTDTTNGCTSMDTVIVNINNTIPDVNAGADSVINCINTSIALNGSSATPDAAFSWSTTAGIIVSGANTANPVVSAGGNYYLAVTDTVNGCMAMDTVNVTVDMTPPNVSAGNDTTLTCIVTQVTLNGSSTTVGAQYAWTATSGGVIFSGANTANPVVQIPGTYILTVTNPANGCTAMDSANVNQDINTPNANAGADKVLNCLNPTISLSGSSTTASATYLWSTANGNIVSGGTTLTPTVNLAGTYVLTVTNTINGCMASDTVNVTLDNTIPDVDAGADGVLTCIINSVILEGSSSTIGVSYSWSTTTGNIILGGTTSTPTVNAAGSYMLTVTDTVNGCMAMDTTIVILNNTLPDVDAGVDSTLNCIYTAISLSGSSATADVSFSWTTATGNIVSGAATATPLVDTAGVYVLTITDNVNGCTASDSVNIMINMTPPDVNAGPDTTLTCVVTQVNLSGSSTTPGAIFTWVAVNGGVIVSGANTANPLVQIPGTYVLTVTNPVNGCTASDSADVFYDNTVPNADAGGDMTLNCVVSSTTLNGNSTTIGAIALWSTTNGNIVADGNTFDPTVDMAGTYVLTVTHPTSGCTATDTVEVMLNINVPDVDAGMDTIIGCGVTTLTLHGSSNSNVGFNWTTTDGNIVSGANTDEPVIDAAGTYVLTVIDRISGCSATDTVMIVPSIPPVVDLGNDTTVVFCVGSLMLDAGNPGMEYLWSNGDTTQTTNVSSSGTYWVTVTNEYGCPSSDTIVITVNPGTFTIDLGNDTTFMNCHAPPFILDAGISGAVYVWSTTEITQTITVTTSGTYWVHVTDTLGCTATDTINVTIINNNIDIDLGPDTTVCTCIQLTAATPGATSYTWCSGEEYPFITVCTSGTYCVTVSNGTCVDSDTVNVTITSPPVVDLGNDTTFYGSSMLLDAGHPGASYMWNTGDTTQTITVTASGTYYVTVTEGLGCVASDTIVVNLIIGITENEAAGLNVQIYPNPSTDKSFTLNFNNYDNSDVEINIMNVLGKVVYSEKLINFSGQYNKKIVLKDLAGGIYFTNVISNNRRGTTKIILE